MKVKRWTDQQLTRNRIVILVIWKYYGEPRPQHEGEMQDRER